MKTIIKNKMYIMLMFFVLILTILFLYIKQENIDLLWSNGFGLSYVLMFFYGSSLIISFNIKI